MTTLSGRRTTFLPTLIAVLLVASAALFGIGVALERHAVKSDRHASAESGAHTETGAEGNGETNAGKGGKTATPIGSGTPSERVLGIPVESTATVAVAVIFSLLLAVAAWRRPKAVVLLAAAIFAAAAAVLDIAEIGHQLSENRAGIAALAGLVAALHLAVIAASGMLLLPGSRAIPTRGATP